MTYTKTYRHTDTQQRHTDTYRHGHIHKRTDRQTDRHTQVIPAVAKTVAESGLINYS